MLRVIWRVLLLDLETAIVGFPNPKYKRRCATLMQTCISCSLTTTILSQHSGDENIRGQVAGSAALIAGGGTGFSEPAYRERKTLHRDSVVQKLRPEKTITNPRSEERGWRRLRRKGSQN